MAVRIWDKFLTERDRTVFEQGGWGALSGCREDGPCRYRPDQRIGAAPLTHVSSDRAARRVAKDPIGYHQKHPARPVTGVDNKASFAIGQNGFLVATPLKYKRPPSIAVIDYGGVIGRQNLEVSQIVSELTAIGFAPSRWGDRKSAPVIMDK